MTLALASPGARRWAARLQLLGSDVAFALMAVLARRLSRPDAGFDAGQLTVVRFVVGVLVSLVVFWLRPGLYRPVNYRLLITRGLSGGVVVVLYFTALERIPTGEASLLYNLFPVIATVMSFFTFGERPTPHLLGAVLLATAGVALSALGLVGVLLGVAGVAYGTAFGHRPRNEQRVSPRSATPEEH
ncbi:DMT family transporter [Archangium minus]|uniref:DMT family transporter n=1 Tax=Archangium minus TaxID=83450 RepID=A0ABY9WXA1_9BACT|nr:DMT family transporter [Archangium minus]